MAQPQTQLDPVPIALLLCDRVIEEAGSAKKSLIGIFTKILMQTFPHQFGPFYVYISFTNVKGKHGWSLNILHEEMRSALAGFQGEIDSPNAKDIITLVIPIPLVVLAGPGTCDVEFNLAGKTVLHRHLLVEQVQQT